MSVINTREQYKPTNTSKTMDSKVKEFYLFCDHEYPNVPYKYILDDEKCYMFMCIFLSERRRRPVAGTEQEEVSMLLSTTCSLKTLTTINIWKTTVIHKEQNQLDPLHSQCTKQCSAKSTKWR